MDVDNGFYMVKCDLPSDKEKIMSEGPWMLFDHYLAVSQWTPEFALPVARVEKTMVWIRFLGLKLLYYDENFLLALASTVGSTLRVDSNTLNVECGRFARICVEVDLTKPVVGTVNINDHWYKVQYEGLHILCATCGYYGHYTGDCTNPSKPVVRDNPKQTTSFTAVAPNGGSWRMRGRTLSAIGEGATPRKE